MAKPFREAFQITDRNTNEDIVHSLWLCWQFWNCVDQCLCILRSLFVTKQVINHVAETRLRKCWITQGSLSLCKYYANRAELVILDAVMLFIVNNRMKRQNASAASCYMENDRTVETHDWWGNPSIGLSVQSSCVFSYKQTHLIALFSSSSLSFSVSLGK